MGKKKQKLNDESSIAVDLKSLIIEHSLFFDKLVDLIPSRFYLPTDDQDKPWYQGLSKKEKVNQKKETRENLKLARKIRLDPDKSTTTLEMLKQSIEKEKSTAEEDENETDAKPMVLDLEENNNRSVTYEELRQKLHRKIEELRGSRNNGDREKRISERKEIFEENKRKRESDPEYKKKVKTEVSDAKVKQDVEEASNSLTFGYVKLGDEEEHGRKKKRKMSKFKELDEAAKLEEAKKDPEKGEEIAKKHMWKAAVSRATGVKVHDDPKLLKKKISKEKKVRQKNAEKWKERVQSTQKLKAEKQEKRSGNINERIQQKKQRKIEKREKKLMRPGFEGRKDGFINASST
ncbi:hypothetical protein ACFE04_012673 [Oxalis oulophora]